jgi:hypothetical protein
MNKGETVMGRAGAAAGPAVEDVLLSVRLANYQPIMPLLPAVSVCSVETERRTLS